MRQCNRLISIIQVEATEKFHNRQYCAGKVDSNDNFEFCLMFFKGGDEKVMPVLMMITMTMMIMMMMRMMMTGGSCES